MNAAYAYVIVVVVVEMQTLLKFIFFLNFEFIFNFMKGDEERRAIVTKARKDVPTLRQLYKERQAEIQCVRRENLEKKERADMEQKEQDRVAEIERLQKDIQHAGGLRTTAEDIDAALARLTTGRRGDNQGRE